MKIDEKNYVPILKWKRAEHKALFELRDVEKDIMIPLIELVMPKPKSKLRDKTHDELYDEVISIFLNKKMLVIPEEIKNVWDKRPIFVDFSLLYTEVKFKAIEYIIAKSHELGLNIIPVFNLAEYENFSELILKIRNTFNFDVCLRISISDLQDIDKLNTKLDKYLSIENVHEDSTYLIVDLKELDDQHEYLRLAAISQNILNLNSWKGFVLANGSFPVDLTNCKIDKDNFLPRLDWLNWKKIYKDKNLNRTPTFSDYGIRHPIYIESYQFLEPTASVKYTLDESWLVVKGKKRKFEYFLGAAKLLFEYDGYYGENFSSGDKFIAEKAAHYEHYMRDPTIKGTGTTELWLKAGLNHHFCIVFDQLSNLV